MEAPQVWLRGEQGLRGEELPGDSSVSWRLSNKSLKMRKPVQEESLSADRLAITDLLNQQQVKVHLRRMQEDYPKTSQDIKYLHKKIKPWTEWGGVCSTRTPTFTLEEFNEQDLNNGMQQFKCRLSENFHQSRRDSLP